MKVKKRRVILMAVLLVAFATGGAFGAKENWPAQLRFPSGPPGGTWFALGGAIADMWTKSVIQVTSGSGGGVSNIVNAGRGEADLGLSTTSMLGAAAKGLDPFKEPVEGTALFANIYRQYTYFIMRKDYADKNGVKSVKDIVAKKLPIRFATLKPGTSSEFAIRSIFEKGFGVKWDDIKSWGGSVSFASYSDGADLLADNHLDCFAFQVSRVASVIMDIESRVDVVLLPVDQEARDVMAEVYGTTTFNIEPGVYKSVTEPVPTVGDYTCIVVAKALPEDLVYELSKALWEHKDELGEAFVDMKELNPEEAISEGVPVHPGAEKFWSELK